MSDRNPCESWIERIWEVAPDSGEGAIGPDLAGHLEVCSNCKTELLAARLVHQGLDLLPEEEPPQVDPAGFLKSSGVMDPEVHQKAILTAQEVAAWLDIPMEQVLSRLDQLPAFEFAGHIRFRRDALERWLERREREFKDLSLTHKVRSGRTRPG